MRTAEIHTDMLPVKFPADTPTELEAIAAFLSGQKFVQSTQVGRLVDTPDRGTFASSRRDPVTSALFVEVLDGEGHPDRELRTDDGEILVAWFHDPTLDIPVLVVEEEF